MEQTLKKKVEAIMFTVGRRVSIDEIKKLSGVEDGELLKSVLNEIKEVYEKSDSSLRLIEDYDYWKMSVKEEYGDVVNSIVTETELSKSLMETLAVIAWQHPTLQADVARIRTNKAYEDLGQLEEMGFITRSKHGRTRKINLTDKFFQYFDLPEHKQQKQVLKQLLPDELKDKVQNTEDQITAGENAIEQEKIKKEFEKQKQETLKTMTDSEKEIHQAVEAVKEPEK
ncbi:MAG: SMC-Scp complex subunit ScpB [Candidatus Woesearchaeota archaeon]